MRSHENDAIPSAQVRKDTKLRVGLLLDSFEQPLWQLKVIEDLLRAPFVDLCLIVLNQANPYPPPRDFLDKLRRIRSSFLLTLYERFDQRMFGRAGDPLEERAAHELLRDVPVIHVQPRMTKFCDYFSDSEVDAIRAHDLDVAVRFGFRIMRGAALNIARYGVWSWHHGDSNVNRGGPAGFWEVVNGEPVTGSILQILTEEMDNGRVIYRSWAATDLHSVVRNRRNFFNKSGAFVLRKLRDLHECGPAMLCDPAGSAMRAYSKPLYRAPTNADMLRFLSRLAGRYLTVYRNRLFARKNWAIAYKFNRHAGPQNRIPDTTMYGFKRIPSPRDRFWADPFPVLHEGRYYVFFEEFVYAQARGRIGVLEIDEKLGPGEAHTALERPYHVSYPNILRHGDDLYMIPETCDANQVELYRCTRFPDEWVLDTVLIPNVQVADPTIVYHEHRWWMFAAVLQPGAESWDELHLYHATDLKGPWLPHRGNPVKSDIRSARPAGNLFHHDGALYRPAQDGSPYYGRAISINRVEKLDLTGFAETETSRIQPEWAQQLIGIHTLNAAGRLTTVDVLMRRSRWAR